MSRSDAPTKAIGVTAASNAAGVRAAALPSAIAACCLLPDHPGE